MKWIAVVLLAVSPSLFAQRYVSPSGFGRILFPGGTAPGGPSSFSGGVGGGAGGNILFPGTAALPYSAPLVGPYVTPGPYVSPARRGPTVSHQTHAAGYTVPYPVLYGGYGGYGYYGAIYNPYYNLNAGYNSAYGQQGATTQPINIQENYAGSAQDPYASDQQQPPVVIINQYFREQGPPTAGPEEPAVETQPQQPQAQAAPSSSGSPMFLIALKDHSIFTANAYWIEDGTLHYITTQGSENSASLDLVDREMSSRLNRERNVAFGLPAN